MGCMKCGRDTISEQVFCPDCLVEMEKYPVRPGTVVQLPSRRSAAAVKKQQTKKRAIPLEDQVKLLKKRCRILLLLLILMTALAAAMAVPTVNHLTENHFKIGQNYNTVIPTDGNDAG